MKIIYFLSFIAISLFATAQKDYVVTLKGDTVYGSATILPDRLYDKVSLKGEGGKQEFKSIHISTVNIEGKFYDPINYNNKRIFGQRAVKGPLSLYKLRPEKEFEFYVEILIDQKQETSQVPNIGFKKIMSRFFSDCPELAQKIESKELVKNDMEEIISTYNSTCAGD